jgi:hypothetical protein
MQQRTTSFWDGDPQVNGKRYATTLPAARSISNTALLGAWAEAVKLPERPTRELALYTFQRIVQRSGTNSGLQVTRAQGMFVHYV